MRIAILGSTGQIGTYLHKRLMIDHPSAEIIACSRTDKNRYFKFDPFNDPWEKLGKVDVLINSIGIIREERDMNFENVHVGLTNLMLENRKLIGDPRIIQISVLGADAKSFSPFLNTKAKADQLLLNHENTAVVRPSIVCTPGTMIVQKFRLLKNMGRLLFNHLPFPSEMLKTKIQPVLGDDLSEVISQLTVSNYSGVIEVGGPEKITLKDLIEKGLKLKPIAMNQKLADVFVPLIAKVFPALISPEQFYLLKDDNVTQNQNAEKFLKSGFQNTWNFWEKELA